MFELQFTNDIPAKDFEFVDCCQDLENNEELQDHFIKHKVEKGVKIFLLDEEDIKKTSGCHMLLCIANDKLWFDYDDKYLIVDGVEKSTEKYFLDGNRKYIIAAIDSKTNAVKLIAQYIMVL